MDFSHMQCTFNMEKNSGLLRNISDISLFFKLFQTMLMLTKTVEIVFGNWNKATIKKQWIYKKKIKAI